MPNFIDGFLGLASAVGAGTATEFTMPGYARQPISFGTPANGVSKSRTPWSFGAGWGAAPMAGRAIYDAPTGGNLLLVLPHYTARPCPMAGPADNGDAGDITLIITAMAAYPSGDAFTGHLPTYATIGSCFDVQEVIGTMAGSANGAPPGASVIKQPGGPIYLMVYASPLTTGAGNGLAVNRGVLSLGPPVS